MLTKSQLALHWRLWSQVVKQLGLKGNAEQMDAHRHGVYAEALGNPKSLTQFTNGDLDRVLSRFRVIISDYTNIAAQVQADNPDLGEAKRRLHIIKRVQPKLLSLYVEDPFAYIEQIMRDKFGVKDTEPIGTKIKYIRPLEELHLHELDMLRSTVARAIDKLRQKAGHTVHDMYSKVRLQCPPATACRKCAMAKLNHTAPAHV